MLMSKSSKMLQFINYQIRVTIHDGRQLIEKFMAFDRHVNLVLGDCEEFRKLPPAKAQPGLAGSVRGVGGLTPGMMHPQMSRSVVSQLSAPPMTYLATSGRPPVIRPPVWEETYGPTATRVDDKRTSVWAAEARNAQCPTFLSWDAASARGSYFFGRVCHLLHLMLSSSSSSSRISSN
ncbi:Small nuclear ribonucleoprotein family protein [Melia azedarach]|uniref:Small nuclear ribonucleoprotein family protein n=1 Tax=Melia azedarach TaxID=155640 RepID=A0ACC1X626_MELAZ|nr:Small nuclear ribonucleoprotein family protein [Melia azedarach]